MKIMIGDINTKVGNDSICHKRAIGKGGCGSMNGNGGRMLECRITYNLVIGWIQFVHPEIDKLTYKLVFP